MANPNRNAFGTTKDRQIYCLGGSLNGLPPYETQIGYSDYDGGGPPPYYYDTGPPGYPKGGFPGNSITRGDGYGPPSISYGSDRGASGGSLPAGDPCGIDAPGRGFPKGCGDGDGGPPFRNWFGP